LTIVAISGLNFFGPRHTGNLALIIAALTFAVVCLIAFFVFPFLPTAWEHTEPLHDNFRINWIHFTGVIVALSGVESIANMTGVMRLDPDSTSANPTVTRTAAKAIIIVMLEVSIFTALFSLAINALPGLIIVGDEVSAPGYSNVRDSMLRYMGEYFCSPFLSQGFCSVFGIIISIIFAILLLSAVNTALIACSSLLFVMARDGQLPKIFSETNRFGVPHYGLLLSGLAPIIVLSSIHDMLTLASLYAIGFIGAIATNIGSTSTDMTLSLKRYERVFMFIVFIVMAAIEITLFIEKSNARVFAVTVIALGLLLRGLVQERQAKHEAENLTFITEAPNKILQATHLTQNKVMAQAQQEVVSMEQIPSFEDHLHSGAILCAASHSGKTLEFALQRSKALKQKLYVLYIREQKIVMQKDVEFSWLDDQEACEAFDYAITYSNEPNFTFLYAVSDLPAINIVEYAKSLQVSSVVMGMPRGNKIMQFVRGNIMNQVFGKLPADIDLFIVS
jgi:hypothetical protein